jgi:hypothetical protein
LLCNLTIRYAISVKLNQLFDFTHCCYFSCHYPCFNLIINYKQINNNDRILQHGVNGYSPKSDADDDIFSQLGGYNPKSN